MTGERSWESRVGHFVLLALWSSDPRLRQTGTVLARDDPLIRFDSVSRPKKRKKGPAMNVTSFRAALGVHAEALALREQRAAVLTSNIANAATPNFKARDIDFEAHYSAAIGAGPLEVSHKDHIATSATVPPGGLSYRVPVGASLDGNTVDLATEQMEFAENTVRYQGSLQLLNRRISGLMTAIRGE